MHLILFNLRQPETRSECISAESTIERNTQPRRMNIYITFRCLYTQQCTKQKYWPRKRSFLRMMCCRSQSNPPNALPQHKRIFFCCYIVCASGCKIDLKLSRGNERQTEGGAQTANLIKIPRQFAFVVVNLLNLQIN